MTNTAQDHRQEILEKAMADLKNQATEVLKSIMGDLYTDYLPHVGSDTEANICYRATGIVKNLVAGKFTDAANNLVEVSDGYGCDHYIPLGSYENLVGPLCDSMGDLIRGERIKQLEQEVKSLREMLHNRSF